MTANDAAGRDVAAINLNLFASVLFGWIGWQLWPTRPEWWGMGVVSIVLAAGALGHFVRALRLIGASWQRRKALAAFAAQGGPPKPARLADEDDLRSAGMIE